MLGHHRSQLLRLGVYRVSGQHLAQIGEAGGAQHVFVQDRGVVAALAEERRGSTMQAELQGSLSVRHQTAEGLERVEEAVRPREEVHVVMVAGERDRVEASGRTALQHAGLVALVLQHYREAGQGQRHERYGGQAKVLMELVQILQRQRRRWERKWGLVIKV